MTEREQYERRVLDALASIAGLALVAYGRYRQAGNNRYGVELHDLNYIAQVLTNEFQLDEAGNEFQLDEVGW